LFNFITFACLVLVSIFVNANEENTDSKGIIFQYVSDSQRIEVIRKNSNKCIIGAEEHIELTGTIDQNTVLVIERLLTQLRGCELQSGIEKGVTIYLNSKGGRAHDGVKLGRLFRKHNIRAIVRNNQLCASACAFAFVGANYRIVSNDAELLFHAPFKRKLFGISCEDRANSQWLKDYFMKMLGKYKGSQLFDKTISTCGINKGWPANTKYINSLK